MAWPSVPFPETVRKTSVGRQNQIPASEIKAAGRFPVIDQGQSFIAGYSDDESRLITRDLPLIVFGDHTRVVKFVDFPFILGADGTKVLKPREDDFDARFFAFALQSLNLPNRGYNRHFTSLKERRLFRPEIAEQRRIAGVLESVRRAITQQERLMSLTTELKRTLLHQLFSHGLCNEPQKQTELGPIPRSWKVMELQEVALAFDYGTSVKCVSKGAGFPVLRIPNVVSGSIDVTDLKYGQPKRTEVESLRLRHGDLLFVRTNGVQENAGRCALFRSELSDCYFASYLIRVRTRITNLLPAFLNEYASTERGKSFLAGRAIRTADGKYNINSVTLRRLMIPLPSLAEQKEIIRRLDLIEQKGQLQRRKHAALSALFRTLLHELMTARLRVHNIDLGELGAASL